MQSPFEKLAKDIHQEAVTHGLVAYWNSHTHNINAGIISIRERGPKGSTLLEVEALDANSFMLVKHRTDDLTLRYQGRLVDFNWLKLFLAANAKPLTLEEIDRRNRTHEESKGKIGPPHGRRHNDQVSDLYGDWRDMKK